LRVTLFSAKVQIFMNKRQDLFSAHIASQGGEGEILCESSGPGYHVVKSLRLPFESSDLHGSGKVFALTPVQPDKLQIEFAF